MDPNRLMSDVKVSKKSGVNTEMTFASIAKYCMLGASGKTHSGSLETDITPSQH